MRKLALASPALLIAILLFTSGIKNIEDTAIPLLKATTTVDTIRYPDETHFKNLQQLTFGGDNAEAYWSYDGK